MWMFETHKHCDDQCLVAYLDGESSVRERWRVKYHLLRCWQCRTRLSELERQVRRLSTAYRSDAFPSPGRVDAARRRFLADAHALGLGRSCARPNLEEPARESASLSFRLRPPRALTLPAFLTLAVMLVAAGLFFWFQRESPDQWAKTALASAQAFEESLQASPQVVRQTFLVEIIERKPKPERRHGRLEILSDARHARFSSRWRALDGSLRHAVWKPTEDTSFVYRGGSGAHRAEPYRHTGGRVSLIHVVEAGDNAEALERGFMRWLETREWRPLSLSSELALFTNEEGALFRAEPVAGPEGDERIRLTAFRRGPGFTVEIVVELDRRTYRPQVKRIRYESPERSLELIFVARPVEFVSPQVVKASLFRPPKRLLAPSNTASTAGRGRLGRSASPDILPERPSPAALANLEAEALFALHRLNVCRGEQVEVIRESNRVVVRGVVETAQRKQDILSAVERLAGRRWLAPHIMTVGEIADRTPSAGAVYSSAVTERIMNTIPIHDALVKYFEQLRDGGEPASRNIDPQREVQRFAVRANARWDAVWTEAFALRRLAERYPAEHRLRLLSQQNRWLIETIVQDHLRALHEKARFAFEEIEPVFRSLVGAPPIPVVQPRDFSTAFTGAPGPDWQRRVLELFRQVTQCHKAVRSLLTAGRERPGEKKKEGKAAGTPPVEATISTLLNRAARLAEASANLTTAAGRGTDSGPPTGPP